jgi:D-alanyl-D-alanine carboxypeptidase/D-alanyl-D-alanine-endopeptidase (penicillin-binding protein 4)
MTSWRRAGSRALLLTGLLLASGVDAGAEPPLQALAVSLVGAGQGVYAVAEDGTVLAEEAAARAVHPASVTKIATTLALLQRLGPAHRFETRLAAGGPHDGDTLRGDLVVTAGGDPFLADEGAFLMLQRLHDLGIRRVQGRLAVRGLLLFNWDPDPAGAGLARTLTGKSGAPAWAAVRRADDPELGAVALRFGKGAAGGGAREDERPLLVYRSPPLLAVLKALNGYSNNIFHEASEAIGGPAAVEAAVRASVPPAMREEILIANGAGAGTKNRISPRATVAFTRALARELAGLGHDLTAVLPVSGIDPGTLRERLLEPPAGRGIVVGKTGTYGSEGACGLAGALRTARWGTVTFAILNRGVAVPEARRRQDAFVAALVRESGAEPWPYRDPAAPAFGAAEVH